MADAATSLSPSTSSPSVSASAHAYANFGGLAKLSVAVAIAVACLSAIYPGLLRPLLSALAVRFFQSKSSDFDPSVQQRHQSRPPPGPGLSSTGQGRLYQQQSQQSQPQASLLLAIVLPIYSVAIVCFLIYTLVRFLSVRPAQRIRPGGSTPAADPIVYDASTGQFRSCRDELPIPATKSSRKESANLLGSPAAAPSNPDPTAFGADEPPLESLERDLQRLVERLDARERPVQQRDALAADCAADRVALRRELAATEARMVRLLAAIRNGDYNSG